MRLPTAADGLIASGAAPFIAVMAVAGPTVHEPGRVGRRLGGRPRARCRAVGRPELADDRNPRGRALEGLCAGGFGAVDIGLRHPGVFEMLGSFEGYFAPVFRDGPFAGATKADLRAHDPSVLLDREAPALRRRGVRFYLSAGGNHGHVRARWTVAFADELRTLRLPRELWLSPFAEIKHFWRATLPSALVYADAAFS
jgi:putative esterase